MANHTDKVGAFDRLSFTVFLALAVHALLIFGINFTSKLNKAISPTLEVTLSQHKSNDEIDDQDADFLSDANQQGSGTLDEKLQLTTDEQSDIEDNQIFHTVPTIQSIQFSQASQASDNVVTSQGTSDFSRLTTNQVDSAIEQPIPLDRTTEIEEISDVATLKALLDETRQSYANRPRIRTLTSTSTKRAIDAVYIYDWLQEVERVGNQNYPEAARLKRLSGSVRLAVSINSKGNLLSVKITGSSGHAVLDQAAKRIVYLAAPFPNFSPEMEQQYDVLEIIRTWQFRVDNRFGVADER